MNLIKRNTVPFPSIIDEFLKPDFFGGIQNFGANVPAVNIRESETEFAVELAAPGKRKEDFIIDLDDNVLTISSETKTENEQKDDKGKYTRREFSYSSFKRSFSLPETVNEDEIKASYENGVLHVTMPKKEEALPKPKRMIEIG
ncbi:Hsp20/alpha crystallin family protein [Flavobacterium sp.]|jgi:HSP20 family protein|uniref:Hsp20/alpha crystallin family protein n=1 Tax=Flavobacterium sp. TaxID=239 RepID=UPI0035B26864